MSKLTDNQIELLQTAAAEKRGFQPSSTAGPSARALTKRGLLEPSSKYEECLVITAEGRKALKAARPPAPDAGTIPAGKVATLVALMSSEGGATLGVLMDATGWQAHSVRGAIAGAIKKKLGRPVLSERRDGQRVYRIAEGHPA